MCRKTGEQGGRNVVNIKWRKWETEEVRGRAETKQKAVTKSEGGREMR